MTSGYPNEPLKGEQAQMPEWLTGAWLETADPRRCDELWTRSAGDNMAGVFKWMQDGAPRMYELMIIERRENGIQLHLKHFGPDLVGFEEKDESEILDMVLCEENRFVCKRRPQLGDPLWIEYRLTVEGTLVVEVVQSDPPKPFLRFEFVALTDSPVPGSPVIVGEDPTRLEVDLRIPQLSPSEAFAHFTEPDLLSRWWAPEGHIEPRIGGAYRLAWPEQEWQLNGEVRSWSPGTEFAFAWSWAHEPDQPPSHVTVRFEPSEKGCHVRLTHGPYEQTEEGRALRDEHASGWKHFLAQLGSLRP